MISSRHHLSEEEWKIILDEYYRGTKVEAIEEEYKVTRPALYFKLRRDGLPTKTKLKASNE